MSVTYIEGLFARLESTTTPHVARRDEPDVCRILSAHSVFSVAADFRFPLLLGALENLDTLGEWKTLADRMRRAAPQGVFGLWLFDDQGREQLIVSWGSAETTWMERSSGHGLTPVHDSLVAILLSGLPMPVIGANISDLLQTSDVGERFYRRVAKAVRRISKAWKASSHLDDTTRHELSLLLVSRLLFLHFIQEKQWLPERDFIASLCRDEVASVYRERLQPLFFDALNLPFDARISGVIPKTVPYLNGGLFSQSTLETAHPTLDIDNRTIRELLRDTFAPFRFTDAETQCRRDAIAPQMLGEIFERLMHVDERAQTGAFYTPRKICDEIVQEALWTTLEDRLSPRTLRHLEAGELLSAGEAVLAQRQLLKLRILDPSSGTGAFLLSAGTFLETIYFRSIAPALLTPKSPFDLRRHIVTQVLSGIDIQPTAVLLTTLRLWLWVCAALRPEDDITPLPNLEHRIRCGNTLLSTLGVRMAPRPTDTAEKLASALKGFGHLQGEARNAQLREIEALERALVHEHLEAYHQAKLEGDEQMTLWGTRPKRHQPSAEEIQKLIQSSSTMTRAGIFDPSLHFADVMQQGGFDIIVGNPPWLPLARLEEPLKTQLRAHYSVLRTSGARSASPDLSIAFMEASERLLCSNGTLALLMPEKAIRANWGREWRGWMSTRLRNIRLRSYPSDGTHGFRASVYPCAMLAKRIDHARLRESPGKAACVRNERSNSSSRYNKIAPVSAKSPRSVASPWRSWPSEGSSNAILMTPQPVKVGDIFTVRYGVKTAANEAYFDVRPADSPSATINAVRGKDIRPFELLNHIEMIFPHDIRSGSPLTPLPLRFEPWVQRHEKTLKARKNLRAHGPFWSLQNIRPDSLGWRVIWRDIATSIQAVVLAPAQNGGPLALNTTYGITCASEDEAHLLCAWLNSRQATEEAKVHAQLALNQHFRFDARTISTLVLPEVLTHQSLSAARTELITLSKALHASPQAQELKERYERLCNELFRNAPTH